MMNTIMESYNKFVNEHESFIERCNSLFESRKADLDKVLVETSDMIKAQVNELGLTGLAAQVFINLAEITNKEQYEESLALITSMRDNAIAEENERMQKLDAMMASYGAN